MNIYTYINIITIWSLEIEKMRNKNLKLQLEIEKLKKVMEIK